MENNNTVEGKQVELNTTELEIKLKESVEKVARQKANRVPRPIKGEHLLPQLKELAAAAGVTSKELTSYFQLTATLPEGTKAKEKKAVYLAKRGGRVDLSGFTVECAGVKQISEQEAKDKHLGKVRGTLDFEQADAVVLSAFTAVLENLKNVETVAAPVAKAVEVPAV